MAMPDLGKMIGPLPLGAWLAIVAVGGGVALYTRNNAKDKTTEIVEDTSMIPGVGTGVSGQWINLTPPEEDETVPDTEPLTNDQWGRQAVAYLIGYGMDPVQASVAVGNYLQGEPPLTAQQLTLIGIVILRMGIPPDPIIQPPAIPTPVPTPTPTPTPTPKPTPKPVPSPTSYRYYTVVKGNTLWGIAKRYYGAGWKWPRIYNANIYGKRRADGKMGMIKNPNLIYPGWRLLIPR